MKTKTSKKWWKVVVNSADPRVAPRVFDIHAKNIQAAIARVYDKAALGPEDSIEKCECVGQPNL